MIRTDLSYNEFIGTIKAEGWEFLSDGLYASVYQHAHKGTVLKIYSEDVAYTRFLNKIKKLANPYFPKVYSIKKYESNDEKWIVVELERLQELIEDFHSTSTTISKQLRYDIDFDAECDCEEDFDADLSYFVKSFDCTDNEFKNDKALIRAIKIIQDLGESFRIDLHTENTMLRKTENKCHLVFTDPVFSSKDR